MASISPRKSCVVASIRPSRPMISSSTRDSLMRVCLATNSTRASSGELSVALPAELVPVPAARLKTGSRQSSEAADQDTDRDTDHDANGNGPPRGRRRSVRHLRSKVGEAERLQWVTTKGHGGPGRIYAAIFALGHRGCSRDYRAFSKLFDRRQARRSKNCLRNLATLGATTAWQ